MSLRMNHCSTFVFLTFSILVRITPFLSVSAAVDTIKIVDENATPETKNLFTNLKSFSQGKLLFGHQDDLAHGVAYKYFGYSERSDIKILCDEYPAVIGWDIGHIEKSDYQNLDGVRFSNMRAWIRTAHQMNCINTISWHSSNPVTGGYTWDVTAAVPAILPGRR